jgi:hypothetical protein
MCRHDKLVTSEAVWFNSQAHLEKAAKKKEEPWYFLMNSFIAYPLGYYAGRVCYRAARRRTDPCAGIWAE